jgi:hypothetical protein
VGGNGNFKRFMEEHGVPANASLVDKYNSEVCRVYKEMISRLAEVCTLPHYCDTPFPARGLKTTLWKAIDLIHTASLQGKPWQSPKQKPTFRSSQSGLGSLGSSGNSSQNRGSGGGGGGGKKVSTSRLNLTSSRSALCSVFSRVDASTQDDSWERWLDEDDKGSGSSGRRDRDRKDRDRERSRDKRRSPSPSAESVDSSSGQSRESALRSHTYNGDNEQLQRFRTSQAISSDDYYGNSQGLNPSLLSSLACHCESADRCKLAPLAGNGQQQRRQQDDWNTDEYLSYLNAGLQKLTVGMLHDVFLLLPCCFIVVVTVADETTWNLLAYVQRRRWAWRNWPSPRAR